MSKTAKIRLFEKLGAVADRSSRERRVVAAPNFVGAKIPIKTKKPKNAFRLVEKTTRKSGRTNEKLRVPLDTDPFPRPGTAPGLCRIPRDSSGL